MNKELEISTRFLFSGLCFLRKPLRSIRYAIGSIAAVFCLFIGLAAAADMSQKSRMIVPYKVAQEKVASLDDVARLVALGPDEGKFELVDSRPFLRYSEGHIPGAISIPDADFDKFTWKLTRDKDRLIVFYCAGPGRQSCINSDIKAEKLGYTRVKIFPDGLYGWKKAGYLVASSVQSLRVYLEKEIPVVLVDLRPVDEARKGHIISAVSIPGKDIPTAKDRFPSDKSALIVLYDNDTKSAADDFISVRGWGYTNTSVLEGGFEEWKRLGGLVVSGNVATRITYMPKLRPGEISVEEFKRIAETPLPDKLMLDGRDEDEAAQGMLKGAINVPSWDIRNRQNEILMDKELIVYCTTGVRAEITYHILKEFGYSKVRFLNANIRIDRDGKYTITKE
ncbi:MAG: sulfurtransferase [Nitrospirae bacterium]|nr:sulfurtransferase [Nitrospirota bacterium]